MRIVGGSLEHHTLLSVNLHFPELKLVVAQSHVLPAGCSHIFENDFPGYDIWKFLYIGIVGHFWVEI